jgi:hypothetical protein
MISFAFLAMIANGPFSSFVPIIINNFGFNQLNSLLPSIPAGKTSGITELGFRYAALKIPRACAYIMFGCECLTILAAILLWKLPRQMKGDQLYGCYTLGLFGAAYAVGMDLQVANTAGYTKRSVASSGLFMGYCFGKSPVFCLIPALPISFRRLRWTPPLQA